MKNILSNYLYTVMYRVLLLITPFITTPYVSRVLKPEGIGIDAYVMANVQLFIVFIVLSFPLYGSKQIASQHNKLELSKQFWSIFSFQIFITVINIFVYIFYVGLVSEYKILYTINILTLLASGIDISWYFFGKEQIKKVTIRNVIVKITGIILIFSFVKDINDLNLYVLINAITLFVGQLVMWIPLFKEIHFTKITFRDVLSHIKPILILFIPQIMIQIYSILNKILLGRIASEVEVGYYNQAYKVINIALGFISSLGSVMLPRMASEFSRGNLQEIKKYINFTLQFILMITIPMTIGLSAIAPNFILWFLGEDFLPVTQLVIIMSPVIFFVGLANVFGIQILIGTNQQNKYSLSVSAGAILSLLANLLLIRHLNSVATAIALLIAEGIGALIQMYFARKYFNPKKFVKLFFKYTVISSFIFIFAKLIENYSSLSSILLTFVQIFVGIIVYIIGLLIIKDPMLLNLINSVQRRRKTQN